MWSEEAIAAVKSDGSVVTLGEPGFSGDSSGVAAQGYRGIE